MSLTIKEVAMKANVSIATVSHVINKTRYVSPELTQKVERVIEETGYSAKLNIKKIKQYRVGKQSEIAFLIPNTYSIVYFQLVSFLSRYLADAGFILSTYFSEDDLKQEKHIITELMSNRRIAGLIITPVSENASTYKKLIASHLPFVCLERTMYGISVDNILSDNVQAAYKGTEHLIKCGHENIVLLLEKKKLTTIEDRLTGYKKALLDYNIVYSDDLVLRVDLNQEIETEISKRMKEDPVPTAWFAGGNTLTLRLLKTIADMSMECPKDMSIIGFGDDSWCDLVTPTLTTFRQNTDEMAQLAVNVLIDKIQNTKKQTSSYIVPMELTIRKSTQNIARGPFGEKAVYPEEVVLSEEEVDQLRAGNYKVALSFHYSGDEWTKLHEKAIKEVFSRYGIWLLSVADAHFDPELQITQLEGIMMQHPDAIIAVPTDEEKTAEKFKEISKKTKLIFINNMPKGFKQDDYACWISVNERENGQNAAMILKNYFQSQQNVKIGLLTHGTPFFATKQRDFFAEQTFRECYPNIKIVAKRDFFAIDNAYEVCRQMIQENPEIQGLYITWERPALKAIKALEDMSRTDIVIATTDLDYEIASYMANKKMVIGLSSQQPYDQGIAVAIATAKSLLGKNEYKCIGVPPYTVVPKNLTRAWQDLIKTKAPDFKLKKTDY